jgi:hypothetical protein
VFHLIFQDLYLGIIIGQLQIGTQSPTETTQKPFLYTFQVFGRLITSKDQLLTALVKMIENREECILRFFCPVKKLNIINDQYIDELVKMYEIIDRIVAAMIYELIDEFFGTDI